MYCQLFCPPKVSENLYNLYRSPCHNAAALRNKAQTVNCDRYPSIRHVIKQLTINNFHYHLKSVIRDRIRKKRTSRHNSLYTLYQTLFFCCPNPGWAITVQDVFRRQEYDKSDQHTHKVAEKIVCLKNSSVGKVLHRLDRERVFLEPPETEARLF